MPAIGLCILGGGSHYTHHMLHTFAAHVAAGDLAGSTICLYDINQETARLMADFGNSVAKAKELDFDVRAEPSLEKALEGSDFVFSSIRVGGYDQLEWDESVPTKYGLLGQETTGVSGVFMICRQARAIQEHARAIERICPQAIVINYSNPSGMVTDLTRRVADLNCVGLCDGVYGVKWLMCTLMGLPMEQAKDIDAYVAGVNHCTWTLALRYRGEDLYPRVRELLEKFPLDSFEGGARDYYEQTLRIYRYYGLLPGSTYYTRYHFYAKDYLTMMMKPEGFRASRYLRAEAEKTYACVRSQIGRKDADFTDAGGEAAHGDQAMGALHKMACNTHEMETVNVRNNGAISNLPDEVIVEIPGIMTRQGVLPLSMGPLPDTVVSHVHATAVHYKLSVDAAISGDRNLVMQAAMAFPSNVDLDVMEKCVEELFEKHKGWLPQFEL